MYKSKNRCCIVKDNKGIAKGFNAAPKGIQPCTKETCLRNNIKSGTMQELDYGVHAEQNAILDALHNQINIDNCTMYVTKSPCMICAKNIINAGITRLVYGEEYNDTLAKKLLNDAKIELVYLDNQQ